MNKAKVTKMLIKGTIGAVTTVLIGLTIKQEKRIGELLDVKFGDTPSV